MEDRTYPPFEDLPEVKKLRAKVAELEAIIERMDIAAKRQIDEVYELHKRGIEVTRQLKKQ